MADTVLAAQLYTIRDFMKTPADLAESLKKVKEIGYDAVQLSGHGEIDDKELKKYCDDAGLIVCATHVSFDMLENETEKAVEFHKLLDCSNVAIGGMPGDYRGSGEGFKKFAEAATVVGQKLAEHGLRFGYHNHSFELRKFDGTTGLDILYDNSDPKYVMAEIDTYWVQHGGGSPEAWLRKLKGRVPFIHLKDMVMTEETPQMFAEIGEGNLDWDGILKAGQECDVEWYIVEQDRCDRDPFEALKISLDNLKAMGLS
ncbi:sugar phosphate isomerase/epimerase family protein [Planctomycetota bacterium]